MFEKSKCGRSIKHITSIFLHVMFQSHITISIIIMPLKRDEKY